MSARRLEVCLYSSANLNLMSGSSIWVQSVAEMLQAGLDLRVTMPLRCPERRRLITDPLRHLPGVDLVPPTRLRRYVPPTGLNTAEALDLIEALDRERHFDAIILRSFPTCRAALERPSLRGRIWSCYILEPERDIEDPAHLAELTAITEASERVLVQSEEMRALFEAVVPAGRGRTIVLPPAIPPAPADAAAAPFRRRLLYAGKFHPFYPVERMLDVLTILRPRWPDLEFHVIGDQFFRPPRDDYADRLEQALATTPGVVWHGALTRAGTAELLAQGGVALSLWDYRHGSTMNDLVVSMKLLDYCAAGLPVVLTRTAAQETILGADFPLFVDDLDQAGSVIERVLGDEDLYRAAAERCRAGGRRFEYPAVYAGLAPDLEGWPDAALRQYARPKLDGAAWNVGLLLPEEAIGIPPLALALIGALRRRDARFRLLVGRAARPGAAPAPPGADPAAALRSGLPAELAAAVSVRTVVDEPNWYRTIGFALDPGGLLVDDLKPAAASGAVPLGSVDPTTPSWALQFARADEASLVAAAADLVTGGGWEGASARARAGTLTSGPA
jgi:glycosyltransferase involved in cell wall biosynthesis